MSHAYASVFFFSAFDSVIFPPFLLFSVFFSSSFSPPPRSVEGAYI